MSKIYWEITDILEIQLIKKRQHSYVHVVFVDIMIMVFLIFCISVRIVQCFLPPFCLELRNYVFRDRTIHITLYPYSYIIVCWANRFGKSTPSHAEEEYNTPIYICIQFYAYHCSVLPWQRLHDNHRNQVNSPVSTRFKFNTMFSCVVCDISTIFSCVNMSRTV